METLRIARDAWRMSRDDRTFSTLLERLLDLLEVRRRPAHSLQPDGAPAPPWCPYRLRRAALRARGLLSMSLLASLGCGATFNAAAEHNAANGTTGDDATTYTIDPPDRPGVQTVTSNGDASADLSSTSTTDGAPDLEETTEAPMDAPPVIAAALVQGSPNPAPITAAGPVTLSVIAYDDNAIDRVHFFIDHDPAPVAVVTDGDDGVYRHELIVDHQDDAGDFEFHAVVIDDAGQSATSDTIAWTVTMPESGATVVQAANEPLPNEHIYWNDVAVDTNGEFIIVGHRVVNGVTSLLSERRSPSGALLDSAVISPTTHRVGVAVAFMGSALLVAARDPGGSWIGRYNHGGALEFQQFEPDVEWRDLLVVDDRVMLAGNTGELVMTETAARVQVLTPTLTPDWERTESSDGNSNVARALAVHDDQLFAVGHVTLAGNERRGAVWAYALNDGAEQWTRVFTTTDEDIFDVATFGVDGIRTAGSVPDEGDARMMVHHLKLNGDTVADEVLVGSKDLEVAYAIAASSHGEHVIAGATCTGECFADVRRYANTWYQWHEQYGLLSPVSRVVAAESLAYGYVVLLGQHDVNYGDGDQTSSWLRVLHP